MVYQDNRITRETVSEHLGKGGSGTLPDLNQVQKELESLESKKI